MWMVKKKRIRERGFVNGMEKELGRGCVNDEKKKKTGEEDTWMVRAKSRALRKLAERAWKWVMTPLARRFKCSVRVNVERGDARGSKSQTYRCVSMVQ